MNAWLGLALPDEVTQRVLNCDLDNLSGLSRERAWQVPEIDKDSELRRVLSWLVLLGTLCALPCPASSAQEVDPAQAKTLETMVVTGTMPGPQLWKVTHGDNVLWLLGTVSPLPKDMDWDSTVVEEVVSRADEVIAPGWAEPKIGAGDMFKMALLARSAGAAMKLPDGSKLEDVLPADVHRRWAALGKKYMGKNRKVERWRPLFASQELYFNAISAAGMTRANVAWNRVAQIAEAHGKPITRTQVTFPLAIDRKRYKAGIAAISESRVNDRECFARTISGLESDLEVMKRGANAWAVGDMEMLRQLERSEVAPPCKAAYDTAMGFQQRPEVLEQVSAAWVGAADRALRSNSVTFAVLPIDEIVGVGGLVSRLRSLGYAVVEPSEA